MIILHNKRDLDPMMCYLHMVLPGACRIVESGGLYYLPEDGHPICDASLYDWFCVPDQYVPHGLDDGKSIGIVNVERVVGSLGLRMHTEDTLPKSQHYAKVTDFYMAAALPIEVKRFFACTGLWYEGIRCLVTEQVLWLWQQSPKQIAVDDIVLVAYVPDPRAPENDIPIVHDKVVKTW